MILDRDRHGDKGNLKIDKEVASIFSAWTKRAIVDCLQSYGHPADVSNTNFDLALTRCLEGVTDELIIYYSQYLSEE